MGKQRVSANLARVGGTFGHADRALPDRSRVADLNDLALRIEEFIQVREVDVGADVVRAEVVHRIDRREVYLSRDRLAGSDAQRRLSRLIRRGEEASFLCGHLKAKPLLAVFVAQLDVSAR